MKTNLLILIAVVLISCNPYKKIAVAPKITPANKELLSQTCERYFPPGEPKFIKGETIIKVDTFKSTDTLTILDTFNNVVTKYVTKTNTVTVERLRTDTVIITNKYEVYRLNTVISKQNEQLIRNEENIKALELQNRRNKLIKWSGWGVVFGFIALFISRQYLKSKFKF